ncbi:MAG: Pr6Pr family membrane protein [bacterium]|nr:Pr6Pr family membrane protein [bacterium]
MLIVGAFAVVHAKPSKKVAMFRGAAALYMIITGIVFSLLLSGLDNVALTAVPWDNVVLHYIMPIVLLVDWLVDRPAKALSFKQSLVWLIYPAVYVIYSLIRGALVGWYPYPFLNPETMGYLIVVSTSVGILVLSIALVWVLSKLSASNKPLLR